MSPNAPTTTVQKLPAHRNLLLERTRAQRAASTARNETGARVGHRRRHRHTVTPHGEPQP